MCEGQGLSQANPTGPGDLVGRLDIGSLPHPIDRRCHPAAPREQKNWPFAAAYEERGFVDLAEIGLAVANGEQGRRLKDRKYLQEVPASEVLFTPSPEPQDSLIISQKPSLEQVGQQLQSGPPPRIGQVAQHPEKERHPDA